MLLAFFTYMLASSVHASSLHPLLAHHHLCYVDHLMSIAFFFIFLLYATFLCDSILDCLCTYFCLIGFCVSPLFCLCCFHSVVSVFNNLHCLFWVLLPLIINHHLCNTGPSPYYTNRHFNLSVVCACLSSMSFM